ncbi:MAG: tRNA (guanosine(37)-N1)-methyltransferase TrmD, partial [Eubacterium sp.]
LQPGVLPEHDCMEEERHFSSLLEYPQYTRPYEWRGRTVPDVLLTGHHANVDQWRRQQSLRRTLERRPDMLENASLSEADKKYLSDLK